jgi:small subunit ribosomal protein S6
LNPYEITFIVRPDLDEDGTRAAVESVTSRIQRSGGEIIATLPWNPPRRRMAYPINEFGDGFYVTCVFRLDGGEIKPLENALKLNDRILRYLLVQATEQNIQQARQRLAQQMAPRPQPVPAGAPAPGQQSAPVPAGVAPQQPAESQAHAPETPATAIETPTPAGQE